MASIKDAIRMCKRIMLTNLLTNDYSIAVTPLLSGKHGIGKSQVAKNIARDLGGTVMVIEGGTLKEGEITGIPYQCKNESGDIEFRFLPYYIVQRIQKAEQFLHRENLKADSLDSILAGEENKYAADGLSFEQKVELIRSGQVKPVILFFDEINRTDMAVFRELMNIILTRTVNGYRFPWWVFLIAAMNPSTQSSMYATNEMDPAQLDRFIKIKVHEDANEWVAFAVEHHFERSLVEFISGTPGALSPKDKLLEDDEKPLPSPRGWHMVDLILKGRDKLDLFFSGEERRPKEQDIRAIISAKVGGDASAMLYSSLSDPTRLVLADEILGDDTDEIPQEIRMRIKRQSTAKNAITSKSMITYLKDHVDRIKRNSAQTQCVQKKLIQYIGLLDMSSILMFSQALVNSETPAGTALYDCFYEVFDDDLMNLLQQNNMNDALVRGKI